MTITDIVLISLCSIEALYCLLSAIVYIKHKHCSKKRLEHLARKYQKIQAQLVALEVSQDEKNGKK